MNHLDVRIDLVEDVNAELYVLIVSLWDGDIPVASRKWKHSNRDAVWKVIDPFIDYWTRLYFDNPELSPEVEDIHGDVQLPLGI